MKRITTMKYKVFIMASMIFTMQNTLAAAAGAGVDAINEEGAVRAGGELRLFRIGDVVAEGGVRPEFSAGLRTYMSVSAISRDVPDVALTFKATTNRDGTESLWFMLVRFMPLARSYGSMDVLKSKVEAKFYVNPDTYRKVYGVDFEPKVLAREGELPADIFFKLSDGLGEDNVRRMNNQRIFEWPISKHFPRDRGLQADRAFGHVTPQDIINSIDTLRTLEDEPSCRCVRSDVYRFPWYTLRGIDYHKDATNGIGFAIRALSAFEIPMGPPLSLYLNHDYAADYRWYRFGHLAFLFDGPRYLRPERFIGDIRRIFFEEGRDARGGRGGDGHLLRELFPDAYPHD